MGYVLGVDLGTTFSAAAVSREGRAEIVSLGTRGAVIPSIVLLRADGEVLVGEAAERRSLTEPERTAREFKRRLGDPTPLMLGGTPYGAEALTAHLLRAIVGQVTELHGEAPEQITVCHPANYGPFKLDLLAQAVRIAEAGEVTFLPEPQAAALHYASQERVEPGEHVAVYDFGGGTFDAAVLRRSEDTFELIGVPEGLERLGGIDFDQVVFGHVERAVGQAIDDLDPDEPATLAALTRLRDDCRTAKETLSHDTDAQIPVLLPTLQTEVRITRVEFEAMIRPRLKETVDALERAISSAGMEAGDIARVLLVGGTSRIPLVGELVREATGRPVALDAHPKHSIALGASMAADRSRAAEAAAAQTQVLPEVGVAPTAPSIPTVADAAPPPPRSRLRRNVVVAAAVAVVLGVGATVALAAGGGDDRADVAVDAESTRSTSTSASTTSPPATTGTPVTTVAPAGTGSSSGMLVTIDSVRVDGETYVVEFDTAGFTPGNGPGDHHVHFYFGSSDVGNLISGGATDDFVEHAGPSPFRGLDVSDRPPDILFLCASVADAEHVPFRLSGNCALLPG